MRRVTAPLVLVPLIRVEGSVVVMVSERETKGAATVTSWRWRRKGVVGGVDCFDDEEIGAVGECGGERVDGDGEGEVLLKRWWRWSSGRVVMRVSVEVSRVESAEA